MSTQKRMTKTQVMGELSERTGLDKRQVQSVLDELRVLIKRELAEDGPGEFVVPDLIKLRVKVTPGREAHMGIDPFTKQERHFDARPESRKVRATPLKALKDLVV